MFPPILRVLDVRDTRDYDLVASESGRMRWRPVPGTGEPRPCDRCGRDHEVYVDVECADGARRCVGTGCAEVAGLDALAARLATGAAEVARLARMLAAADDLPPEPEISREPAEPRGHVPQERWICGDCSEIVAASHPDPGYHARTADGLRAWWRRRRRWEACGGEDPIKVRKALKAARLKLEGERRRAGLPTV